MNRDWYVTQNTNALKTQLRFNKTLRFILFQHNHKIKSYDIYKTIQNNEQYVCLSTDEINVLLSFIKLGYLKVKNNFLIYFLEKIFIK